ncbi:hypothetical protein DFH29DRAFT_1072483 [Suillus ampliporus]|nr:hypothetical protein DFH29DRAFT_1072483 [Suillus ampliporus]
MQRAFDAFIPASQFLAIIHLNHRFLQNSRPTVLVSRNVRSYPSDFIADRDNLGKLLYWADETTPAPIDVAGTHDLGDKTRRPLGYSREKAASFLLRCWIGALDHDHELVYFRVRIRPRNDDSIDLRSQVCFDAIDCVETRTVDPADLGSQRCYYCTYCISDSEQKDSQALITWADGYYGADAVTTRRDMRLAEGMKAFKAAEALYLTAGKHENAAECQGRFIQFPQVLEAFQDSDSWKYLGESTKAKAWYFLDDARIYTFTASADKLFVKFWDDPSYGLLSKIWHWRAKFCYGRDIDIVQKVVAMSEGRSSQDVLWFTIWKAVVAGNQGDYDLAQKLIRHSFTPFGAFALHSARTFLHVFYVTASIELTASECNTAEFHFTATIEGCDIQGGFAGQI